MCKAIRCHLPKTSAVCVEVLNQESSPNLPGLYEGLVRKSLGNPQTTDTKCGLAFAAHCVEVVADSSSVEKPLRNARDMRREVQLREFMKRLCIQ